MALTVYVGCGNATGDIQVFAMDPATAALTLLATTPSGSSTSFMAVHPSRRFAYTSQNRADRLSAFAIGAGGALAPLNQVAIAGAEGEAQAGPAHVEVDRSGSFLLAANYRGHNVVVHRLEDDGRIGGRVGSRSDGRHAHSVRLDPSNRFAFVPYLGSDIVAQYRFDEGALMPNTPLAAATAKGAGPRHLDFHPSNGFVYLVNELDSTVDAYAFDAAAGTLAQRQTVPALPADYTGRRWSSDVHVAPNGRFLYVSNRAHESLAVFAIGGDGLLTLVGHEDSLGKTPRLFALDPSGRFLLVANQDSANLVTFAVDERTGRLSPLRTIAVGENPYFVRVLALP